MQSTEQKIHQIQTEEILSRASWIAFILGFVYAAYGVVSFSFVSKYLTLAFSDNLYPRLLFNALPSFLLSYLVSRSSLSRRLRLGAWIVAYPVIITIGACVNVWQIVILGKPEVLLHVHAANIVLYFVFTVVTLPTRSTLLIKNFSFGAIFLAPLFVVAWLGRNQEILIQLIQEWSITYCIGTWVAIRSSNFQSAILRHRLQQEQSAKSFLGPTLARAVFDNNSLNLEAGDKTGVVAVLDIRSYTEFVRGLSATLLATFQNEFSNLATSIVTKHGGIINKSTGDGFLITFGVLDNTPDLSDIPGIEQELVNAETRRRSHLCTHALRAIEELVSVTLALPAKLNIDRQLRIGSAIDYGTVGLKIVGNDIRQELDIFGDVIIRCTRLENHTKVLMKDFQQEESLIVLSPEVSPFTNHPQGQTIDISQRSVRDYPEVTKLTVIPVTLPGADFLSRNELKESA